MSISTNQLKSGNHVEVDGTVYKVLEFQHVNPGKGAAFVRTKLRRASDGNVIDKTFRAGEKLRSVRSEGRKMQFLYADGDGAHFMNTETYEQIALPTRGAQGRAQVDQGRRRGRTSCSSTTSRATSSSPARSTSR